MELLDVAKCGVCLDLYTDPRMLSCGHTYCQACLDPTLHAIQGKNGKFFQCPECREETKQTKTGLQKNYTVRSIVDKIKTSSGSQGVDKCSGCQKTVVLEELFRCTTCKENSASAADAEIRVCGTCIAKTHKGHDYQELEVASKADFDELREKIDGYNRANDVEKKELEEKKRSILTACEEVEKISYFLTMIAKRTALLRTLKDDVVGSSVLTKAQLAAKAQQAEKTMEGGDIAAALKVLGECDRKLTEIPSLLSAIICDVLEEELVEALEEQAPVYLIDEFVTPASPASASLHRVATVGTAPVSPRRMASTNARRASLRLQPPASPSRQPNASTSTASATAMAARRPAAWAPWAPRMTARMSAGPISTAPRRSSTNANRLTVRRFGLFDD